MEFFTTGKWDEELWQQAGEIYQAVFGAHGAKPEKIIRNMFKKQHCFLHVAYEDNVIKAMAITGRINDTRILLIDYLAVRLDSHRQGVGKKLAEYIKNWALSKSVYDWVLIEVESENTRENKDRIHFWEKCGFSIVDQYIHHYIWVPEPYLAMILPLHFDGEFSYKGKELFKYIGDFHKESFKRT
jgi:GNAT superfamily N-acetyltransferase